MVDIKVDADIEVLVLIHELVLLQVEVHDPLLILVDEPLEVLVLL